MSNAEVAAVILAAGMGTRMQSDLPKVLHPIAGRPMVLHVLATVDALAPAKSVVVIGPDMQPVADAVAPHPTVIQTERLGTAHAVGTAREALADFRRGTVLVLYGDTPMIAADTLRHRQRQRGFAAGGRAHEEERAGHCGDVAQSEPLP